MILSDQTIERYVKEERIRILPALDLSNIRPAGIRVHLGRDLLIPPSQGVLDIDSSEDLEYRKINIDDENYVLQRDSFALGATAESIFADRGLVCHLEGRSTIARLGLMVHCTSGIIDGIHEEPRAIVLELKNIGTFDLRLRSGLAIGMLVFSELSSPIRQRAQRQYEGQSSVAPPNLKFRPSLSNSLERDE